MKKRVIITLLAAAMTAGLLTGCGNKKEVKQDLAVTPIKTPAAEKTTEEVEVPEEGAGAGVIPVEREIKDGKMQSYLTGEWKDEAVANRRPIAVMIPNNSPAMPQYGISKASIIYEAPVEGRITRLMAVFEDFDELDRIRNKNK